MAMCVRNIHTKNYQNLMIGFQVTVKNVGDVFETQCRRGLGSLTPYQQRLCPWTALGASPKPPDLQHRFALRVPHESQTNAVRCYGPVSYTWNLNEEEQLIENVVRPLQFYVALKLGFDVLKDRLDRVTISVTCHMHIHRAFYRMFFRGAVICNVANSINQII